MSRQAKSQWHRAGGSVIIAAISLAGVLGNALVAPALPDIARALSVDDTGIGLVVAAASLPGVVVAPIIGVAADRFGRRIVVVPCLVVFGLGGIAAMAAPTFGVLIAARLLQGLGAAGLVNLAVVMIGDRHEGAVERAAAIGRNGAVLIGGLAVLPVVGGGLVALAGWRAAFAPMALTLLVALAAARMLPRGRPAGVAGLQDQMRAAGAALADRRVVAMLVIGYFAFVLVFGAVLTLLPIDLD
ncbi:MAG: MFS transporter, partial [Acidimicrobiia bacterium]